MIKSNYQAKDNTLREFRDERRKPNPNQPWYASNEGKIQYENDIKDYDNYIYSLKTIPCSESCKTVFIDGQVYEEGVHYKIEKETIPAQHWQDVPTYQFTAIPLHLETLEEASERYILKRHPDPAPKYNSYRFYSKQDFIAGAKYQQQLPVAIPLPTKETLNDIADNCSKHKKDIAGISDMKILAETIGDLHYETLSVFLEELAIKINMDGYSDYGAGRKLLGTTLLDASRDINSAQVNIKKAFSISKPFMEQNNKH